jgi:hypothetical protein
VEVAGRSAVRAPARINPWQWLHVDALHNAVDCGRQCRWQKAAGRQGRAEGLRAIADCRPLPQAAAHGKRTRKAVGLLGNRLPGAGGALGSHWLVAGMELAVPLGTKRGRINAPSWTPLRPIGLAPPRRPNFFTKSIALDNIRVDQKRNNPWSPPGSLYIFDAISNISNRRRAASLVVQLYKRGFVCYRACDRKRGDARQYDRLSRDFLQYLDLGLLPKDLAEEVPPEQLKCGCIMVEIHDYRQDAEDATNPNASSSNGTPVCRSVQLRPTQAIFSRDMEALARCGHFSRWLALTFFPSL